MSPGKTLLRVLTINREVEGNYSISPVGTIFWNLFPKQKKYLFPYSIWLLKRMQTVPVVFGRIQQYKH